MDQPNTRTAIQIAKTLAAEIIGVWDVKECIDICLSTIISGSRWSGSAGISNIALRRSWTQR